jgi:hypothetical protein
MLSVSKICGNKAEDSSLLALILGREDEGGKMYFQVETQVRLRGQGGIP